ncbi:MAG TPA: DUF642 domain-containing protein [Accumulibacter sp.]|uniref:DUF642 domain-containing protein n=1 Tax=Accumulibacter sp. TaxID=2053492 RepID=UPI002B813F42|nr:DUF642 domain-containing protein [Accumulibacter sp.]HRF74246.1 DUF642 domain-containing protein [Accumulibacter sp.]
MKNLQMGSGGIAGAALSLFLLTTPAHANLIVNGSFEASPFTANGNYELGLTDSDVPGWHIPASNGTYPWGLQDGAFGAFTPFGNQWVVLGLHNPKTEYSIEQTLNGLIVGNTYNVSFAIASELDCCAQLELSFTGSSTAASIFTAPNSGSYWTDWATFNTNFVATNSSVTLNFKNHNPTTGAGYDLGLDNVAVEGAASVPEPGVLALLGLGLVGFAASRRRQQ